VENKPTTPFEDIESAHEYLTLLGQVLLECGETVEADLEAQQGRGLSRRVEALRIVVYKLERLGEHVKTSRRLLNDLRSLRRLLQDERQPRGLAVDKADCTCEERVLVSPVVTVGAQQSTVP